MKPPFNQWPELLELVLDVSRRDEFVLHGSVALGFYTVPRNTLDMDLMVSLPAVTGRRSRLARELLKRGFKETKTEILDDGIARRFTSGDWAVDVHEVRGASFRDIRRRAVRVQWRGRRLLVMSDKDLAERKGRRGTLQDFVDIQQLRSRRNGR